MVQLASVGVVGWNVALVARFGYQFLEYGQLDLADGLGWLAYLPLSTALVLRGVRGSADRVSWLMLAAMAAIVMGVLPFSVPVAAVMLGPLAGFGLVFIRWPWSLLAFATAVAAAAVDAVTAIIPAAYVRSLATAGQYVSYDVVVVVWTGIAVAVLVWLARILRDLQAARQQLAHRALVVERQRIDDELAETIGAALRLIIGEGQDAARLARSDPQAAAPQLRALTARSRTALADARHVLSGYRSPSPEAELRAVTTLLAAAGIRAEVELPDAALPLKLPGTVRAELRTAVARALSDGVTGHCVLAIGRDEAGELGVRLVGERSLAGEGAA
jgi:two-component system sensor histidine kinase DesK